VLQPLEVKVEVEELVVLLGVSLQCAQPQLLEGLGNRVEASSGRSLGGESPCQVLLGGDDEVQTPEAHMCAPGLVNVLAGHPKPDESDETRKGPYLARQLSAFRNCRLVNLVDCSFRLGWLCKEDTRMYTGSG
jgi:hypothetical protein